MHIFGSKTSSMIDIINICTDDVFTQAILELEETLDYEVQMEQEDQEEWQEPQAQQDLQVLLEQQGHWDQLDPLVSWVTLFK